VLKTKQISDDLRKKMVERIQQEVIFESDMRAITTIADVTGTEIEDGWQDKTRREFEEMLDAKMMCPKGCVPVWNEEPAENDEKKHTEVAP
jgi:hypothetical protein